MFFSFFFQLFLFEYFLILATNSKGIFSIEEKNGKTYAQPISSESQQEIGEQMKILFDIEINGKKIEKIDEINDKISSKYMENLYKKLEKIDESDSIVDENSKTWFNADKIVSISAKKISNRLIDGNYQILFNRDEIPLGQQLIKAQIIIHFNSIISPVFTKIIDPEIFDTNFLITNENPIMESDVTSLVSKWMNEPDVPLINVHSTSQSEHEIDAFLVIALKDENTKKSRRRYRRDVQSTPLTVPILKRQTRKTKSAYFERPDNNAMCQKKGLYVDFEALGWKQWIIAPLGFSAFYCIGECRAPFHQSLNATSHAIVQSLIHLARSNATTQAKCAPSKLSSMKILLKDNKKNIQIKKYRDMVVEECGCH